MLMNRSLASSRASAPRVALAPSRGITSVSAVSKSEVSDLLAEKLRIDKSLAAEAVSALLSIITTTVASGEDVTLVGFGSFKSKQREARKGRNPKTGAELDIPAKKGVSFTAGKQLKEAVNGIVAAPRAKAATPKAKAATPAKAKSATSAPASPKPISVVVASTKVAPAAPSKPLAVAKAPVSAAKPVAPKAAPKRA